MTKTIVLINGAVITNSYLTTAKRTASHNITGYLLNSTTLILSIGDEYNYDDSTYYDKIACCQVVEFN